MRLWTLHPACLDPQGLVAVWREGLLAQKVLRGLTRGYRHHPQLIRFRQTDDPIGAVVAYLRGVEQEAARRGYRFDPTRLGPERWSGTMPESVGQLDFEWRHLLAKVAIRSPAHYATIQGVIRPDPHPLFTLIDGPKRDWEKG
ncbi:MAG: DNA lyase [Magnetococcales bacterium]|nr:DNA lyase [Magnetococcales bacterium]